MIRPVVSVPDERLRAKCERVSVFDAPARKLAGDLIDTLRHHRGFGLTTCEIGELVRIVAINPRSGFPFMVLVNPAIVGRSIEMVEGTEGCLSINKGRTWFKVKRHVSIEIEFTDRADQRHRVSAKGMAARVLQHQLDHLDGKMIAWPVDAELDA